MNSETVYDYEDLIEYCPETPESNDAENDDIVVQSECEGQQLMTLLNTNEIPKATTTKIMYVCSMCYRQYGLVEDLRGHMIEYHNCTPIEKTAKPIKPREPANTNVITKETVVKGETKVAERRTKTDVQDVKNTEMRPVPFKDFRLILRSKLTLRCSVTFSCSYKFENIAKLELHAKCHTDSTAAQFKCSECSVKTKSWRLCSAHLWKTHHIDIDLLHCPVCAFKAHASVLVWRHMRMHKKWRPRVLRSLRAVQQRRQQNLQKANEEKPPPPPNKNKYYSEKICEICSRKFVNGKTLSKHVKTVHNKIKPFICNVCGRKTARKASLIIHMRQHTGEKPLQCKICKFSTRDPSVLSKHQSRHEEGGKFKCLLCKYSCIQTTAYKRHVRLNHPEEYKKIACDLCNYVTISEQRLQAHKEDHRKGLIITYEDSMDATRAGGFKNPRKMHDKNNEISADCFLPLESIDSLPHEPAVDTGGVTIPAPSEDTQFPTYLNN